MHGIWRKIGLGALVGVVIAAGAILLLSSGESSPDPPDGTTAQPHPETTAEARPRETRAERRHLRIPEKGHPLVWVRGGRTVEIHSSPGGPVVRKVGDETEFGSSRVFAVERTEGRWAGVPTPFTGNGALGWVRLDARDLRSGYTKRSIVVDLSEFRATLLKGDRVARTFTVSIGAPGTDTPTGRFAVTDTFRGDLNPAYGCCAVALTAVQPNLDSGWIGGDRVAIHGTTGPLGVAVSHGCVRAADRDVSALVNAVPPGAPVTIKQ
jgi:L,D-transpeptidase catalytic domain